MKVAVVGSRSIQVADLEKYLPEETTEILSGGAAGADTSAREYALAHAIPLTEFLPDYRRYGRAAPLKRNISINESADLVLAFWDGTSCGTRFVIERCKQRGTTVRVFLWRGKSPTLPPLQGFGSTLPPSE